MDRRTFIAVGSSAIAAARFLDDGPPRSPIARPRPSAPQLRWQREELAMFLHFGVNTFTDREWGDGKEDPALFAPAALDARQWARSARAAGFRSLVLTAKHHDGFCLWPTATTSHSVRASGWRNGDGDVVREFVDACRAEGLRAGLYCSPWDRNHPAYGDSPRYNDVYWAQLSELCTRYGPLAEVWFDGANGEGPNGKRQVYDWPRTFALVKRLQADAVIFSDAGPDVRWCGNETGSAGDPNWSTVDPTSVPHPGAEGPGIIAALQHGDPQGTVWRPAEADTSIRPGWFYHASQDEQVRTVDDLVLLYERSVGRNSKLLLNVPPTRSGLLHETDVDRLAGMRQRLDVLFENDLAGRARTVATPDDAISGSVELDLGRPVDIGMARLAEDVERGQRVARYTLRGLTESGWQVLSRGTTIGHAKIDRFPRTAMRRVRLSVDEAVEALAAPVRIAAFAGPP